jgi:hypothetical protein
MVPKRKLPPSTDQHPAEIIPPHEPQPEETSPVTAPDGEYMSVLRKTQMLTLGLAKT